MRSAMGVDKDGEVHGGESYVIDGLGMVWVITGYNNWVSLLFL